MPMQFSLHTEGGTLKAYHTHCQVYINLKDVALKIVYVLKWIIALGLVVSNLVSVCDKLLSLGQEHHCAHTGEAK